MSTAPHVTLYHAPNTRFSGALSLLEALQANYTIALLNIKTARTRALDAQLIARQQPS
jgi:hypothetical protein